jgi:hypothetical protein
MGQGDGKKGKRVEAVAYIRTSSAANVGADKDSDKRQRGAIEAFAKAAGYNIVADGIASVRRPASAKAASHGQRSIPSWCARPSGCAGANTGTVANMGTWTGTVSNAGTFNNNAGGTVSGLLTNNSGTTTNAGALNGGAVVNGGLLTVNGSAAAVTVNAGGTLGGTGAVLVNADGTGAPGSGVPASSMTVSGNLAFASGAQYLVQLNPATASFTNVSGTATLGGATVNATYANGSNVSKQYTIVNATGGVNGTFGSLVNANLPANFTPGLSYDATHAFLNLTLNFTRQSGKCKNSLCRSDFSWRSQHYPNLRSKQLILLSP